MDVANRPLPVSKMTIHTWFWPLTVVIAVLGTIPRLFDLGTASYWTDEVLAYFRASGPLADVIDNLLKAGNQGPLYYMMMRVLPHETEFWMRLPSALLGMGGIVLLILFVRNLYKRVDYALWAGALLATNPYHIWLSRTARAYSLLFVLVLIVLYLTVRLARGDQSRGLWITFTLASALAYLTHYAAGGLAVAQMMLFGVLIRQNRAFWVRWVAAQTCATIPFAIWVLGIILTFEETHPTTSPGPGLADLPLTFWNLGVGYAGDFTPFIIPALIAVSIGLIAGAVYAVRRPGWVDRHWVVLIVVSLVPVLIISFAATGVYLDRYFIVFLPGVLLLLIRGANVLSPRLAPLLLGIVLMSSGGLVIQSFITEEHHREDWRAAAEYVATHAERGDGYLLERPHVIGAFRHYTVDHIPADEALLHDLNAETDTTAFEATTDRIWVIYRNPIEDLHRLTIRPDFDPFDPSLSAVGAWLADRRERVQSVATFNGITVLLVEVE